MKRHIPSGTFLIYIVFVASLPITLLYNEIVNHSSFGDTLCLLAVSLGLALTVISAMTNIASVLQPLIRGKKHIPCCALLSLLLTFFVPYIVYGIGIIIEDGIKAAFVYTHSWVADHFLEGLGFVNLIILFALSCISYAITYRYNTAVVYTSEQLTKTTIRRSDIAFLDGEYLSYPCGWKYDDLFMTAIGDKLLIWSDGMYGTDSDSEIDIENEISEAVKARGKAEAERVEKTDIYIGNINREVFESKEYAVRNVKKGFFELIPIQTKPLSRAWGIFSYPSFISFTIFLLSYLASLFFTVCGSHYAASTPKLAAFASILYFIARLSAKCFIKRSSSWGKRIAVCLASCAVATLIIILLNNIIHAGYYSRLFGWGSVNLLAVLKADLTYSFGLAELRYVQVAILYIILFFASHFRLIRHIFSFINSLISSFLEATKDDEDLEEDEKYDYSFEYDDETEEETEAIPEETTETEETTDEENI